ncbi:uncharacterized protein LOC111630795 [Centruroides sculpturatus]|uniref:uncharacterized protein LOC111630795 n=1 Tax=Centruroides sculpturatus TaxID=218467 RepID=UPI000C6CCB36|nr:uncharacterized protein LOC111630795 [Centruroides sculpturatus]
MLSIKGVKKEDLRIVAEELCGTIDDNLRVSELRELITKSDDFACDPDFVLEILTSTVEERKRKEEQESLKREQERLERERQHELELARISATIQSRASNGSPSFTDSHPGDGPAGSIEKLITSVKTLTLPVPTKSENWNLFFVSIERASQSKNVPEEMKSEILINILGEKTANILIYITGDELTDYSSVKKLVLREYEPSAQCCLENFRSARRRPDETHMQFMSRIASSSEYYCELRRVKDLESLKRLIVADRLFQTLDVDTAAHISVRQGEGWFNPINMARECDLYFESKGKSITETYNES